MDRKEIINYLENFIINYGDAEIILDKNGYHHYTDFTVADLNHVISTANKDRMELVHSICNREVERQEVFMRCAEHRNDDVDWVKHYELQGVYQTIRDILTGDLTD